MAPAFIFSSYVCPLSIRTRIHVRRAVRTISRYGEARPVVVVWTAAIHARGGFAGATAVRGPVGVAPSSGVALRRREPGRSGSNVYSGVVAPVISPGDSRVNRAVTEMAPFPLTVQAPFPEH